MSFQQLLLHFAKKLLPRLSQFTICHTFVLFPCFRISVDSKFHLLDLATNSHSFFNRSCYPLSHKTLFPQFRESLRYIFYSYSASPCSLDIFRCYTSVIHRARPHFTFNKLRKQREQWRKLAFRHCRVATEVDKVNLEQRASSCLYV